MSAWEKARVVVGHRGVRIAGAEAENTVAAFERAFREGAAAVELDVRLCATGEVVVFHDPDLTRATGGADKRAVRGVPYVELGSLHLFGARQGVPLLREVLTLARDHGAGVNVEVKYDDVDAPRLVRAVAAELARGSFDVLVSSFDPRLLVSLKLRRPRTRVALLTTHERAWSLPLARSIAHMLYAVHLERVQATADLVRSLKRRCHVGVWTVNDPAEARVLYAAGADWIITDTPAVILAGGSILAVDRAR